jgi:hypothetical protein
MAQLQSKGMSKNYKKMLANMERLKKRLSEYRSECPSPSLPDMNTKQPRVECTTAKQVEATMAVRLSSPLKDAAAALFPSDYVNRKLLKGRTLGFHINHLDYRGTGRAIYDYASYSESKFGLGVVIWTPEGGKTFFVNVTPSSRKRFEDRFKVIYYNKTSDLCNSIKSMPELISIIAITGGFGDLPPASCGKPVTALGVFSTGAANGFIGARISERVGCSP